MVLVVVAGAVVVVLGVVVVVLGVVVVVLGVVLGTVVSGVVLPGVMGTNAPVVIPEGGGKPTFSVPVVPGMLEGAVAAADWAPVRGNAGLTVAGRSPGPLAGSVGSVGRVGVPACSSVATWSPGPLAGTVGSVATFRALLVFVLGRMSAKNDLI